MYRVLICLFLVGCAASVQEQPVNEVNENVIERWPNKLPKIIHHKTAADATEDSSFVRLEYFETGILKEVATYNSGFLDSVQFLYYENGRLGAEYNYDFGIKDGSFRTWYESGEIKSDYFFENGMVTNGGMYFENGQIMGDLTFESGAIVSGIYYHENGNLRSRGNIRNGQRSGEWKIYDKEGKLKEVLQYE